MDPYNMMMSDQHVVLDTLPQHHHAVSYSDMNLSNAVWRPDGHPAAAKLRNTVQPKTETQYGNDDLDALTELLDNDSFPYQGQNTRIDQNTPTIHLPDSPPYSGSEPYSPDSNKLLSPSCSSDVSSQSGYRTGPSPDPHQHQCSPDIMINQQPSQQHLLQNQLLHQQQQQLQQQYHQQLQLQQRLQQQQHNLYPGVPLTIPPTVVPDDPIHYMSNSPYAKKRRLIEETAPRQQTQIKQEPIAPPCTYDDNSSLDISPSMLNGGSYQPIKWREFERTAWCPIINAQGQRVNVQTYRLDGDKGFNFSQVDKAFVCQKKNHFQITACVMLSEVPQYVITGDGPKPIDNLYVHFYGVKEEAVNQIIQVDQSQADRSKKKFYPVALQNNPENSWKLTIGRLHFSDTTLNNMRKRGKPNPDQRYFLLVVGLFAHSQGKEYPVMQQSSEKLIVRASNPGQFQDSEAEPVKWNPGQTPNSVYHSGKVGINTDTPDEALTVAGNVKVMGTIMQPSDQRVKEDISRVDTSEQLKNIKSINLYNYKYTEEFADAVGIDDPDVIETGVLAQELEVVIPEAVKTTSDVKLANGEVVENLKVVDKNRLFMESLGAVKELSNITTSLEGKIDYLERFNQKLQKLKRIGSLRSTASGDSHVTSISTVSHVTVRRKHRSGKLDSEKDQPSSRGGVCSNRFLQILIFILIFVMVACVGVILALILMKEKDVNGNDSLSSAEQQSGGSSTTGDPYRQSGGSKSATGGMCLYPAALLTPTGCDPFLQNCRVDTCKNICSKYMDESDTLGTTKPTYATDDPVNVLLGTSAPGVVISYEPFAPKGKPTQERRKRELVGDDLGILSDVTIEISNPNVQYPLTSANCLNCYTISNNYTYAVEIYKAFPGAASNIKFEKKKQDSWKTMLVCPRYELPDNDMKCVDGRRSSWDILPTPVNPKAYSLDKPVTVIQDIGIDKRVAYIYRFTNKEISDNEVEQVCQERLSKDLKEVRLWFVRTCNQCSMASDRVLA